MDRPKTWGSTLVKNTDENKTYIIVKFSESFYNAIQEYSASNQYNNNQNNQHQAYCEAPTIEFQGTRGAIRFPNGKCYDFSLEQSDNSIECIRQTKNKWESVGKMACSLHIKGKDDVYQRTRTKMEVAEQEKRKYCTKLLGSPEHNNTSNSKTTKLVADQSSGRPCGRLPPAYGRWWNYPDITNVEQMKRYKADFYKDMREYQQLHGYLQKIEEKFRKLRELLLQSVEGSPEWESAKEQIFREYDKIKGDSNFHKARSKYRQVYNKLAHIKEKIFQFKRQQTDKFKNNNNNINNKKRKRDHNRSISKSTNGSI